MLRMKPSKPAAVFMTVFALGVGAVGLIAMTSGEGDANPAFMALWFVMLAGIIGFNLWSAFSKDGASQVIER